MQNSAGGAYFENQIATASPERLQFQLLDSALKAAERASDLIERGQPIAAGADLAHAETIVADLIGSMRRELDPALVDRVRSVYAFVLRSLLAAHEENRTEPLRDAVRVLAVERETWRLASERAASSSVKTPAPHVRFNGAPAHESLTLEA